MFVTKSVLIKKVVAEIALASGLSVEQYTVPNVRQAIDDAFLEIFRKRFWPHLTFTTEHTLVSDSIGLDTLNVWEPLDIEWVKPKDRREPLMRLHNGQHLETTELGYETSLATDTNDWTLTVYPEDSVTDIIVRARRIIAGSGGDYVTTGELFADEDVVPFDDIALKHLVIANVLATDESNPTAQARHDSLFEARYTDLISQEASAVSVFAKQQYATSFTVQELP